MAPQKKSKQFFLFFEIFAKMRKDGAYIVHFPKKGSEEAFSLFFGGEKSTKYRPGQQIPQTKKGTSPLRKLVGEEWEEAKKWRGPILDFIELPESVRNGILGHSWVSKLIKKPNKDGMYIQNIPFIPEITFRSPVNYSLTMQTRKRGYEEDGEDEDY